MLSFSLPRKISIFTNVLTGPFTRFETSASDIPLTFLPFTARIISLGFTSANCAGVFSITLIILIFPASFTIFTPIPEIFEVIDVFCSAKSSLVKNIE